MNRLSPLTIWLGYGGIAFLVLGVTAAATLILVDPESGPRKWWAGYEAMLEREVRFLLYKTTGARIARMQLAGGVSALVLSIFLEEPLFAILVPVIALAPPYVLKQRHEKRVLLIESQLDGWLLILANALKAVPSIGEAIAGSAKLMRAPIAEELDLVIKEVSLGTPLDQAVMNMSTRVNSRAVSGALGTVLVGRQTGGDLGRILEESAATLREMSRLEGVIRTKTAEGKAQAYVLGGIPFVLIGAIHYVDENWLRPLTETSMGYTVITVATVLWLVAIVLARRILAVDV